ncbi:argininosuccinate lyase [Candidatus Woesearchaeota archaeon]|nr:argininosuccinate lyase [Candidatus Woesearchaeota archaeon]|tara:strand:- start:23 stop:1198 length:1176 start_codon:yes stop_codon:yes gene_type:complete
MKLWQKNYELNKEIEKFTVGNDFLLDGKLVKYDCIASIAHAKMLKKIDILKENELKKAIKGLNEIIDLHKKGKFKIKQEDEDCHTAIENYLTKKYKVGKKIHTARSRNDQVLTALRLYEKTELEVIKNLLTDYKNSLLTLIKKHGKTKIPGYTHMQKAMPTDIKTWLGGFVASLEDNLKLLDSVYSLIDQSPLGSAAGFDVPIFKVDKKMTSKLMGFSKAMNPSYAQLSRGKFESIIMNLMSQIMYDLNKLSTDLILFNMKELGYISLPIEFCTGSSIMPQKKNPDALELLRAKYHIILGEEFKVKSLIGNLISGYNRDIQLTKEPIITSLETTKDCIKIMALVLSKINVNKKKCKKAMTSELFATEEAYKLIKQGIPFREAYKKVSKKMQ